VLFKSRCAAALQGAVTTFSVEGPRARRVCSGVKGKKRIYEAAESRMESRLEIQQAVTPKCRRLVREQEGWVITSVRDRLVHTQESSRRVREPEYAADGHRQQRTGISNPLFTGRSKDHTKKRNEKDRF